MQPTKSRQSNFELLRIIAMLMVLGLHSNVFSLGAVSTLDIINTPFSSLCRIAWQSTCIPAVNIFIIISGWFGIRPSVQGTLKFLFQCIFIVAFMGFLGVIMGKEYSLGSLLWSIIFQTWFVISYLGLYILSPILNHFIASTTKQNLARCVIAFFVFQTYFGWFNGGADFNSGYSIISFIGLYLLARYCRLYGQKFYRFGFYIFLCGISSTILYTLLYLHCNFIFIKPSNFAYCSPFIIVSALGMVLFFAQLKINYSRIINLLAASSFAVYLMHVGNDWTISEYVRFSQNIYNNNNGVSYVLSIFLFHLIVYLSATAIDYLRQKTWHFINRQLMSKSTIKQLLKLQTQ